MTCSRRRPAVVAAVLTALVGLTAGCSDSQSISSGTGTAGGSTSSTDIGAPGSSAGGGTTSAAPTTAPSPTAPGTTAATTPPTPAPTTPPTSPGGCPGAAGIPAGADIGTTIHGDIDGDLADDTVTEYSLGGVPHVHAQLASGAQSDTEVPIGFADHVEISFNDFDHSLGAAVPPPVAVLAIGTTSAGSAVFTFLTLNTDYCIKPWHVSGGAMFVGRLSAQGPYEGLWCDGAAGRIYTSLTTAETDGAGGWTVTTRLLHHNFTLVTIDAAQTFPATGSDGDIQQQYGDINGCGHAPLFS
ncbi:MAG: hypothetical protein Q7V88_00870 [Actinomycetota bacterium]|nr:hypothetical protein [Actinomycetota bacterium]